MSNRILLVALTAAHAGRSMTLAFLPSAGGDALGSAPAAWVMPLLGDAVIGLSAPLAAWLAWHWTSDVGRRRGATLLVVWHAVGAWDALSAFVVHRTVPWPDFFMVQIFGDSMFFAAAAMHVVALWLVVRLGLSPGATPQHAPAGRP